MQSILQRRKLRVPLILYSISVLSRHSANGFKLRDAEFNFLSYCLVKKLLLSFRRSENSAGNQRFRFVWKKRSHRGKPRHKQQDRYRSKGDTGLCFVCVGGWGRAGKSTATGDWLSGPHPAAPVRPPFAEANDSKSRGEPH